MNNVTRLLTATAVCVALAACSQKVKEAPPTDNGNNNTGASTSGMAGDGKYGPGDLDTDACLRQRVVYFDFDQDTLKPDFQAAIACHAKYLRDRPEARMTLEGNADERGTREYNIALGARRAQAVRDYLTSRGVEANRMRTISYGKERPVAVCNDISCWSQNRRAVTVLNASS